MLVTEVLGGSSRRQGACSRLSVIFSLTYLFFSHSRIFLLEM